MVDVESDGPAPGMSASDTEAGRLRSEGASHEMTGAGRTVHFAPTRGRASSWIAVVIMMIAFTVGGVGVVLWNWWVVGIAGAVFVVAFLASLASGIMNDVH
jgi:hypothetical protein